MIVILTILASGRQLVKSGLGRRKSDAFQWKLFSKTGVFHVKLPSS